ncbi:hypothetical protein sync_2406 [Synechococcus sp. CC9311]|nr:hypothetical protein sync_2406 [Synechococcus sp. CC9311]
MIPQLRCRSSSSHEPCKGRDLSLYFNKTLWSLLINA